MGWTVLYIAFGIVALWLLGEVLPAQLSTSRRLLRASTSVAFATLAFEAPTVTERGVRDYWRRMLAIFFPLAISSTNLSR